MEVIQRLVRTWMVSGRQEEVDRVVTHISDGNASLLDIVKALGEYLTDEEDLTRAKGVEFLALCITYTPKDRINRQSANVLTTFFSSKLEDTETIIPALNGFIPLCSLPTFSPINAQEVLRALFAQVNMKAHVQSTRFLVFSIVDNLLSRYLEAVRAMGDEFIQGYIVLAEGEKDPRNLLLAFSIDRVISVEFDITLHVESIFNITFCYFPITFKPPPDDPYGITTEDLKVSLRSCLASTADFGPLALPLFLEKLQLGSPAIKQDTLQTISVCLPVYGGNIVRSFGQRLWSSLRLEIFQPTDAVTESVALDTTEVLIRTIYSKQKETSSSAKGLATEICEECLDLLREPGKTQAKPAIKTIAALARATPFIADYTLSQAIPHLFALYQSADEVANRPQILTLLNSLITATGNIISDESSEPVILSYKEDILLTYLSGLRNTDTQGPTLEGLKSLVDRKNFLSDEDLMQMVDKVNEILERDGGGDRIGRDSILELLAAISNIFAKYIEDTTIPILVGFLPDIAPGRDKTDDRMKYYWTLQFLKKLCISPHLIATLFIRLTTKLDLITSPQNLQNEMSDPDCTAAYMYSILKCLADAIELKVKAGHTDISKLGDKFLTKLYNLSYFLALSPLQPVPAASYPKLLLVTGRIITPIVRVLALEQQRSFADALSSAYLSGDIRRLTSGPHQISSDVQFIPFHPEASSAMRDLVILFDAGIIALRGEVTSTSATHVSLLADILKWGILHADNEPQKMAADHIVASFLNKNADELSQFISSDLNSFWENYLAPDKEHSISSRRVAIQSWVWISKALLIRNSDQSQGIIQKLFDLLADVQVNESAARAIGEIGRTDPTILTKQNHAVVRVLHAQKYYNSVMPRILGTLQNKKETAYITALVSLISVMPKNMWLQNFSSMIVYLLYGLELNDLELRIEIVNILSAVSKDVDEEILNQHASSLISAMLKCCTAQDAQSSATLKAAALKYVGILPKIIRYDILHPHKPFVIRELGKLLDDSRRPIRKEAVDARTNWFTLTG